MSSTLFRKWRRWVDRIRKEQLSDLLVNQHIFKQLGDCTAPYTGTCKGSNLAKWMQQGYIAFAATAVRRMVEEPGNLKQQSVSLVILLRDIERNIEQNASLFTREWFRQRCVDNMATIPIESIHEHANGGFNKITRSTRAAALSASRVRRDIAAIKRMAYPVRKLVNKVIAHTERDRRKVGRLKYKSLNDAIQVLADTYRLYVLLIEGAWRDPLVPLSGHDVCSDLKKIWPDRKSGT
jgi:hypothetical protein